MLSERAFGYSFPLFWRHIAPRLNTGFLRSMAEPSCRFRHRWDDTFSGNTPRKENDLIAEMAFGLFCTSLSADMLVNHLSDDDVNLAFRRAAQRIALLRRLPPGNTPEITPAHSLDAQALARRLRIHLPLPASGVLIQPLLPGVGILNSSYADLIASDEIIEIKMGESQFRLQDLRQVITYLTLARASGAFFLKSCALVNPRLGLTWRFSIVDLVGQISELSVDDFFDAVVHFIDPQSRQ